MSSARMRTRSGHARAVRAMAATVAVVSALALAGCSGGANASEGSSNKTSIRFLYATGDETWNATVKATVDAYNKKKDGLGNVQLDPLPAGSDYATAMKTMDATGNWPELVDMRDTQTYIAAGKLAPIPKEVTSLLDSSVYAPSKDGNVYIVPSTALNGDIGTNIVYDKDYFAKHNLSVPKTYSDFISLMDKIKANGDAPLATAAGEVWPSDQLWKQLASPVFAKYSDKGGFWTAASKGEASISDLRQPLERLKEITDKYVLKGWQSTQDAQTTTLLVNHQAVMATSSAGVGRLMDIHKVDPKFNAGLFIIPDDSGNIDVASSSVNGDTATGLAISAQAKKDPAKYKAAVDFLKYYYSVAGANVIEKSGTISPNIKDSSQVKHNTSIPGSQDYFDLLKNPKLVWYHNDSTSPNFSAFNTFFRQTRIQMQDGQISVAQAISKTQSEFNKTMKQS